MGQESAGSRHRGGSGQEVFRLLHRIKEAGGANLRIKSEYPSMIQVTQCNRRVSYKREAGDREEKVMGQQTQVSE